jgi:hypothetical protein
LSKNLGASTFWNAKGLSRPAMGLLFFIFKYGPVRVEKYVGVKE